MRCKDQTNPKRTLALKLKHVIPHEARCEVNRPALAGTSLLSSRLPNLVASRVRTRHSNNNSALFLHSRGEHQSIHRSRWLCPRLRRFCQSMTRLLHLPCQRRMKPGSCPFARIGYKERERSRTMVVCQATHYSRHLLRPMLMRAWSCTVARNTTFADRGGI